MAEEIEKELNELKKLSPRERLGKLKEIEDKRKKEIEEAERLIRQTENELAAEQDKKQKLPIPQIAALDISLLTTVDEKAIFKTRRYIEEHPELFQNLSPASQSLEQMAEEEAAKAAINIQPSMIYGAAMEKAKQQTFYGSPQTVTGFEKGEDNVKGFYDSIKGFYDRNSKAESDFYRQRTATGAEEEAVQKKKKSAY